MNSSGSTKRANILIATTQVPYTEGGAEVLVRTLRKELSSRDFNVDVVQIPFSAEPKSELLRQMALWRNLDLKSFSGHDVDLVITTKFPSYMVNHPRKSLWLVHQHRQFYDLYASRFGDFSSDRDNETIRQMVMDADKKALEECQACYTISPNVTDRVNRYFGMNAPSLPPPLPLGDAYHRSEPENYLLSVGRICSIKRVDMMIKAMAQVDDSLKLKIVGLPDEAAHEQYLKNEIDKHHLWNRVEFLGRVSEEDLISLFSKAFAVYYAPFDEDYGYVTLEALASGVPVITCTDSGGVLSYIEHGKNGLLAEPTVDAVAEQANRLLKEEGLRTALAANCTVGDFTATWDQVVESLTAPLLDCSVSDLKSKKTLVG